MYVCCILIKLLLIFNYAEKLLVGGYLSDCKKPCLTTSVSISERSVSEHLLPFHSIYFAIPTNISTTVVKEDTFQLMESLNFLGSNLGLWPGMGLFQLFEGAIALIVALKIVKSVKALFSPPEQ